MRDRPEERKAAKLYARSIHEFMNVIQGYKHGLDAASLSVQAVASLIPTAEAFLSFLLFPPPR